MDSDEEVNRQDVKELKIQTHDGKFHSDDTVAIALLTNYYTRQGYQVSVYRSRDSEYFDKSDILVDVGERYDPTIGCFDHHQGNFSEIWSSWQNYESEIHLSAAGLIWRHFGKDIVRMYLTANSDIFDDDLNFSEETIDDLYNMIYYKIIWELDADDNGIELASENNLNIPALVSALNGNTSDKIKQDEFFNRAVRLVGEILDIQFRENISNYFNLSRDLEIVRQINLDMPYIVIYDNIPTIFKCLDKLDPDRKVKFLIFYGDKECTIKARRVKGERFLPICPIVSEEYLRENLPDFEDIIFIHKAGFLAKTKSLKSAEGIVVQSIWNDSYIPIPNYSNIDKMKLGLAIGGICLASFLYYKLKD